MRDDNDGSILGLVILGICIVIGCFLIYLAWQHYTDNTFDSDRYQLVKIGPDAGASYSAWKFDKRTGYIELCTRTNEPSRQLVCIQPLTLESKDGSALLYRQEGASPSFEPAPAPAAGSTSGAGENPSGLLYQPAAR